MKTVVRKIVVCVVVLSISLGFVIEFHPLVIKKSTLNASSAVKAREKAKSIWRQFSSTQTYVEIEFDREDVNAIADVASHTFDNTEVSIGFNRFGAIIASTSSFPLFFINFNCRFSAYLKGYNIDSCHLGDIYIPGLLVNKTIQFATWLLFDSEVSSTVDELLSNVKISDEQIILVTTKKTDFKDRINNSLQDVADIARTVSQNSNVAEEKIHHYLAKMALHKQQNDSLAFLIGDMMREATLNSLDGNAAEENAAVIWALAIGFGSQRFATLAGVNKIVEQQPSTLRGRQDLALHFLYSAILQQLGRANIGLKIGEFKEILDSSKGGSGFSFSDLAADKAGLAFAEVLTRDDESAKKAQNLLAGRNNESLFFPFIHDLPEGISEANFASAIGGLDSKIYISIESTIENRLAALPLYNEDEANLSLVKNTPVFAEPNLQGGRWYKVDTHIHTRFSDGEKTVEEIALNAFKFGCGAIAITDHGDKNLSKVLSDKYFADIADVDDMYPSMTLIPGFEWNIPPFGGREHATVLFPKNAAMKRQLKSFRNQFDHYREYRKELLSATPAFEWLNHYAEDSRVKPVVIYNHPSRKNFQTEENRHDIATWFEETNLVIGFSGAPGHQRKRGQNNGSYEKLLHTINGWDPSIAQIGGEWDQLLQQGYRISAARAASDFHNLRMDYWPCEFSSTHLFSESNRHNDILSALRQGNAWAQHGNFVKSLAFSVQTAEGQGTIGETVVLPKRVNDVDVNIELTLNPQDWQGFATTLDNLELVIIDQYGIESKQLLPLESMPDKPLQISYKHALNSTLTVFRLRGKSVQPEQHHYMFYSNPIYVRIKE
jgi:hypothetical protein